MACRGATAQRVDWALKQLLAGRSSTALVAEMAEREGVSRRQAQRLVARAHGLIVEDLNAIDRRDLAAQLIHLLMESASEAMRQGNSGAVVGISRELRALVGLGAHHVPVPADRVNRFPRFR